MSLHDTCQQRIILIRRTTAIQWGFRLCGGSDVGTPITIQAVTTGSLADQCGLKSGDLVLAINDHRCDSVSHEDAKMMIIRAGDSLYFDIQRTIQIDMPQEPVHHQYQQANVPQQQQQQQRQDSTHNEAASQHPPADKELPKSPSDARSKIGIIPFEQSSIFNKGIPQETETYQRLSVKGGKWTSLASNELNPNIVSDDVPTYDDMMKRVKRTDPISSEGQVSKSFCALENELANIEGSGKRPASIFDLKRQQRAKEPGA